MKKGKLIIYILISLIIIFGFLAYQYLFKIYESAVIVEPKNLFADEQSTVTISVIPLNAFGWKALFRDAPAEFEITEGESLVEITGINKEKGTLTLRGKSETGKVVVKIKTRYSLLPMLVEIPVIRNLT
jgi:hypothetical protein